MGKSTYNKVQKGVEKQERDLTKERNDRCIPAAHELLSLVANYKEGVLLSEDPLTSRNSYRGLEDSVLEMLRTKDIPVNDFAYLIKLALTPMDQLTAGIGNRIKDDSDDKFIPVVRKVSELIAAHNEIILLNDDSKEFKQSYKALEKDIVDLLMKENIPLVAWSYITETALIPIRHLSTFITDTLLKAENAASSSLWGKRSDELTIKDIEEVLKKISKDK